MSLIYGHRDYHMGEEQTSDTILALFPYLGACHGFFLGHPEAIVLSLL